MEHSSPLLEGAPNFRDFGGSPTTDGRRVRRGRLYRSELLLGLTPADHQTLNGLGIGLVCDLRSPGERARVSNEWSGDDSVRTLALDVAADLSSVQPDKWGRRLVRPDFTPERAREAMIDNYRNMPGAFARDLRALFEYLSEPGAGAVVVHCAVGKDRTGFVSGMILAALGVGRDAILDNYLETGARYPAERMIADRTRFLPDLELTPRVRAALGQLVKVDPDYLNAAFDVVRDRFGGNGTYLENDCGLSVSRRELLRAALLEA